MKFLGGKYLPLIGRNMGIPYAAPVQTAGTNISRLTYQLNYGAVSGATGYKIDVFTDVGLNTSLTGHNNKDVGNNLTPTVAFLDALITPLYTRVRAYNLAGTSGNSNTISTNVRYNLLRHTEDFTNAIWSKNGITITPNIGTPPVGLSNADRIAFSGNVSHIYQAGNQGASDRFSLSIYAKYVDTPFCWAYNPAANGSKNFFNIQNGVLGTIAAGYTATIQDMGNGWYRCILLNTNAQPFNYFQFGISATDTGLQVAGSIDISGAQGVITLIPIEYQPIN